MRAGTWIVAAALGWLIARNPAVGTSCILAVALVWLFAKSPRTYLAILMASAVLLPLNLAITLDPGLPVLFPHRVLLPLGFAAVILRKRTLRFIGTPLQSRVLRALTLYALACGVSVLGSEHSQAGWLRLASILFEALAVYWLVTEMVSESADVAWPLYVLALATILVGAMAITEVATGLDLQQLLPLEYSPVDSAVAQLERAGLKRARATFPHPIEFGVFCATVIPILWGAARVDHRSRRWVYRAGAVLALFGMILSGSSTPLAAAFAGVAVATVTGRRISHGLLIGAGAAILASMMLLSGQGFLQELTTDRLDANSESGTNAVARASIAVASFRVLDEHPFIGYGLNTWFLINPTATVLGISNDIGGAGNENAYAQTLFETGLLGLSALCGVWITLIAGILRSRKHSRRAPHDIGFLMPVLSAVVIYATANFGANVLMPPKSSLTWWCTLAAALSLGRLATGELTRIHARRITTSVGGQNVSR